MVLKKWDNYEDLQKAKTHSLRITAPAEMEVRIMFDFLKNKKDESTIPEPQLAMELTQEADELMENNDPKRAEKQYKRAFEIYTRLSKEEPDKYRNDLAHCATGLGGCCEAGEKYHDAYDMYMVALELYREGSSDENAESIALVAETGCNIGDTYFFRNKYDKAEEEYKKALDIYIGLMEKEGEKYLEDIAYCYDCLAKSSSGKEEYSRSIEYYEKVIEIYCKLIADHKGNKLDEVNVDYNDELAGVYGDIGYIYSCCKNYDDAEKYYLKAAEIFEKLANVDPENFGDSLASQYADIAALYEDMGKPELAKEYDSRSQGLGI